MSDVSSMSNGRPPSRRGVDGAALAAIRAADGRSPGTGMRDLAALPWERGRKALLALGPHDCRWPVGPRFCALRATGDGPYCAGHMARAYRPREPRR